MLAWLPRQVCIVTARLPGRFSRREFITAAYLEGSFAVAPHLRADALVAQAGEGHIVDLQVAAAGGGEIADLLPVGARDVAPEFLDVRVRLRIDDLAAAPHVEVRRR